MSDLTYRLKLRLERYAPLHAVETMALAAAATTVRRFAPRDHLARQGDPVDRIFIVVEGFACRYKFMPDGRRQITAFMLPGDLCDTRTFALGKLDHSIAALSPVETILLSEDTARRLEVMPGLQRALALGSVVQHSIAREWLTNVGHRTSFERLSHLLCELFERLQAVGLTRDHKCELPLTQVEIGDALGLTSVHVNRTLMEMRRSGLLTFQSKQLIIHDYDSLRRAAGFDPSYLHLQRLEPEGT